MNDKYNVGDVFKIKWGQYFSEYFMLTPVTFDKMMLVSIADSFEERGTKLNDPFNIENLETELDRLIDDKIIVSWEQVSVSISVTEYMGE